MTPARAGGCAHRRIPPARPRHTTTIEPQGPRIRREREAKRICHRCPVIDRCRTYPLDSRERYGVWGGTSERERNLADPTPSHTTALRTG
ncbi:WhiB family transcriptional regulator [Rhodococcus opacus]|nr:WhiB family transcriptional regulator [Rhodococcus opacus]